MRVPPPGLLKLDRDELLRDVQDRLSQIQPSLAEGAQDPTDPAWLMLEQAAWMLEMMSEQLDQYPFAVVQHFVHMMGGHLLPAQPALGALVVEPSIEGELAYSRSLPKKYRFFTKQTEETDIVAFVPAESGVTLRSSSFVSLAELEGGLLYTSGQPLGGKGLAAQQTKLTDRIPARVFDHERVEFILVTNNVEKLKTSLEAVLKRFEEKKLGWLRLELEVKGKDRILLTAHPDVSKAFEEAAPTGLTPHGDLVGNWSSLDNSTWTPQVLISSHPMVPATMRNRRPLPGPEEGTFLIPDLPENLDTADLLIRRAQPLPAPVVEAIWTTITNMDTRLAPMKPSIKRYFGHSVDTGVPQPVWVGPSLEAGIYSQLRRGEVTSVAHVRLDGNSELKTLRMGMLLADGSNPDDLPVFRAFGILEDGSMTREALKVRVAWRLPCPPKKRGGRMELMVALDVATPKECKELLFAVEGRPRGLFTNTVLVINAPPITDGRTVTVERNVPEGISLLSEDLVTSQVMSRLIDGPLPRDVTRVLRDFPLADFQIEGREPIEDFNGVQVDPSAGEMTLNAPDETGNRRTLRPGTSISLQWYRNTDGAGGEVPAGSIQLVEQEMTANPRIFACTHPVGTTMGSSRETETNATSRLFAPGAGTAVLPADFERLVRQALGSRGQDWVVRIWTYSERALATSQLWPSIGPGEDEDQETASLRRKLDNAGPEQLLVVLGPKDRLIGDDDLDWARQAIQQEIQRQARRVPTIRGAIVTRFWPLTMIGADNQDLHFPCFDATQLEGKLRDSTGRLAEPPRVTVLLNAGVMGIERVRGIQ